MALERTVFTVMKHDGQWAVEHEGRYFGHSLEKDVAKAAANRQARAAQDAGRLCQVRIVGEHGFFGG
jgi:hypothetical protein